MALLSPSLAGVGDDGTLSEAYRDELAYRVAYALAGQWVGAERDGWLNLLQRAVVEQVAAAYGRSWTGAPPLVGRITARHGDAALPAVLASAQDTPDLEPFLARWFSVTPRDPEPYAAVLVETMRSPDLFAFDATARLLVRCAERDAALLEAWAETD